jgi:hypothetical protein
MQVSVYYQSVVFLILAAVALFASRFEPRPDWQALRTIYRHPAQQASMDASASMAPAAAEVGGGADTADLDDPAMRKGRPYGR